MTSNIDYINENVKVSVDIFYKITSKTPEEIGTARTRWKLPAETVFNELTLLFITHSSWLDLRDLSVCCSNFFK